MSELREVDVLCKILSRECLWIQQSIRDNSILNVSCLIYVLLFTLAVSSTGALVNDPFVAVCNLTIVYCMFFKCEDTGSWEVGGEGKRKKFELDQVHAR